MRQKSWEGGPGFNIGLANRTLQFYLHLEQQQGFPFSHAAVGDGSWSGGDDTVARSALLHDGTVLGGRMDDELVGGSRNNYDGETAHRVDVLATLRGARLLYIFDSTSPVQACERFRRCTIAERTNFECDDMMSTTMELEQRQEVLVYAWAKSHCGHLLEASVDALAKRAMNDAHITAVPYITPRHTSIRFFAKSSERTLMLHASNLDIVRRHYSRRSGLHAAVHEVDALRAAKLTERDQRDIRRLRDDHARLQASEAYPNTGPDSTGAALRKEGCPCGGGPQDRHHLLWHCQLRAVVAERHTHLLPACTTLLSALSACETNGVHDVCKACCDALEVGGTPRGYSSIRGTQPVVVSDDQMRDIALRHMLGIVETPSSERGLAAALLKARPVLLSVVAMLRAAEQASRRHTAVIAARCRARPRLRDALHWMWLSSWLFPGRRSQGAAGDAHASSSGGASDSEVDVTVEVIRRRTQLVSTWQMQGCFARGDAKGNVARVTQLLTQRVDHRDRVASTAAGDRLLAQAQLDSVMEARTIAQEQHLDVRVLDDVRHQYHAAGVLSTRAQDGAQLCAAFARRTLVQWQTVARTLHNFAMRVARDRQRRVSAAAAGMLQSIDEAPRLSVATRKRLAAQAQLRLTDERRIVAKLHRAAPKARCSRRACKCPGFVCRVFQATPRAGFSSEQALTHGAATRKRRAAGASTAQSQRKTRGRYGVASHASLESAPAAAAPLAAIVMDSSIDLLTDDSNGALQRAFVQPGVALGVGGALFDIQDSALRALTESAASAGAVARVGSRKSHRVG